MVAVSGVLISGGLDSCILAGHLLSRGWEIQPIHILTGVTWERRELQAVQEFLQSLPARGQRPLVQLRMPLEDLYGSHWSVSGRAVPDATSPDEAVFLPGRNALLLVKAVVWCQLHDIPEIALAPLGTSPFADAREAFAAAFQHALNMGSSRTVTIQLPFASLRKRDVMRLGSRLPLEHTFSCIAPQDNLHCGRCNKCAERQQSFREAELDDPTRYAG